MGQRLGGKPGDCPVTEDLSDRVLRLPLYNDLGEADQAHVIESLHGFAD
jgi:dTDP-4-amino-4,6-dideoxygalactose transaminase